MASWRLAAAASLAAALMLAAYLASGQDGGGTVRIFADRTLQAPLEEIVGGFLEEECGGCRVAWVWGSSGYALSRLEIQGGGDLYVADADYFPRLGVERGLLEPWSLRVVGYIRLVLVVPEGNPLGLRGVVDALERPGVTLAVGNPDHVSAGVITREALEEAGLWGLVEGLVRSGKVVYAASASEAAALVAEGIVDAAITFNVYTVLMGDRLDSVEDPLVSSVRVPVVVALPVERGPHAEALYRYVVERAEVFWRYGVEPP